MKLLGLLIVLIIVYFYYFNDWRLLKSSTSGFKYWVSAGLDNYEIAPEILGRLTVDIIKLLRYIRDKYSHLPADSDMAQIIKSMIINFNPEVIRETDPRGTDDTSYVINKGSSLHICLRDDDAPHNFVPYSTVLFVAIHELAHIGAYDVYGHEERFWQVFKTLLHEAAAAGIYEPINYAAAPVNYCGLRITYNPLLDNSLTAAHN